MISKSDHLHFTKAMYLAHSGKHRVRVGCVAAIKGTRIAGAFNTVRNVTKNGVVFTDHTFHAEENCLRMVPYELRPKTSLYVCRIDRNGRLKPSYPCVYCLAQIKITGFKYLIYYDGAKLVKVKASEITTGN